MKLQQALNYRATCLIHQKPMRPATDRANAISVNEEGNLELKVRYSKNIKTFGTIIYRQDSLIECQSETYLPVLPLSIVMHCEDCAMSPMEVDRPLSHTAVAFLKQQTHRYSFNITQGGGLFTCQLQEEAIKYYKDEKYYHLFANLIDGSASFEMGSYTGSNTVDQLVNSFVSLKAPKFDPATITNLDQMVKKIKTYILFS